VLGCSCGRTYSIAPRWWIGSEFFATKQPTKIFLTNYCRLFIMSKKNVTLQTLKTNLHPLLRESRIFNLSRTTQCTQIKFVYIHQLDKRSGWLPLVWCQRRGVLPQEQPSTFYLTDIFFIAGFVMYIAYHPSLPLYLWLHKHNSYQRMINMSSEYEYDWYWKISACPTEYEVCDSFAFASWYFRFQSIYIQINGVKNNKLN
jgi:hypothetical protein